MNINLCMENTQATILFYPQSNLQHKRKQFVCLVVSTDLKK